MKLEDVLTALNKKTKTQLVDLFEEMINGGDISLNNLLKYLEISGFTDEERVICEKLDNNFVLNAKEKSYISTCLDKRGKAKISTILEGNKKFDKFIVEYKLNRYFVIAWTHYPRRIGKDLGKKAFFKLLKDKRLRELDNYCKYIIQRIEKYKEYCEENETDEQFILHFSTFCNSKKYL